MRQSLFIFAVLIVHGYAAPQFITFKDGKLGVNFGGYHAGVGLGGLLGGGGTSGGLYAEAGTPFGQAAKAGLGGGVDSNGRTAGGLYAGATAGGDVKAETGLGGMVGEEKTAGGGFARASAAGNRAESGLGGQSSLEGSGGFLFASKAGGVGEKKVYKEEATNEIIPVASAGVDANVKVGVNVDANTNDQSPVIVKEVYVEPLPTKVIEKHIVRTHKPHRHHDHKTAYIGGFISGGANVVPPSVQPPIQRRVDVDVEGAVDADAGANVDADGAGGVTYTKKVSIASNPNFFQDIFNIPISTLKAVSSLLSNAAQNTNVSVQKTASVQANVDASAGAGGNFFI